MFPSFLFHNIKIPLLAIPFSSWQDSSWNGQEFQRLIVLTGRMIGRVQRTGIVG
jgi:hypothetical protein